ncbi:poly(3-hydroxybutyrate) depolymerase [Pseudonocardiaceae bacterium YIM PH 21723]|nr:poly(3-hydroxybutyrate) depolymerase [Pseudonocardiaceae bacterium YIM PH 21723]
MRAAAMTLALFLGLSGVTAASAAQPTLPTGCGQAPPVRPGTTERFTLGSGGTEREYLLHVPDGYQRDKPSPVILAFHGAGGTDTVLEAFSDLSTLDAIVLYPQGLKGSEGTAWQGAPYASSADDVRFVQDLLDRTETDLCVDTTRIFATGKSNGGGFTALLACRLADRIAAFAPVAGAYYPGTTQGCESSPPVPMLEFHGTEDAVIHYEGGVRHGARYPAIGDWLTTWTEKDHCSAGKERRVAEDVVELEWSDCVAGAEVRHYRVEGGGHTWPGATQDSGSGDTTQSISATKTIWRFFQDHPRRS